MRHAWCSGRTRVGGFVLFVFGAGWFWLGDERSNSHCEFFSDAFEGLKDTTPTKKNRNWYRGPYHHCPASLTSSLKS